MAPYSDVLAEWTCPRSAPAKFFFTVRLIRSGEWGGQSAITLGLDDGELGADFLDPSACAHA